MSSDTVIRIEGVGKNFRTYKRPSYRLLQGVLGDRWKFHKDFWALRGVDLQVRRGETLGIIGKNGSGKSTLLQLIAGTLSPSEGVVAVNGKVAALLELGSGFDPQFTGRENVHLNASILGLSPKETEARIPSILEFADIGEFIDQPVGSYSSGMVMRLAFAVMVHVDAEILIIDEALAVGDAFFTQKCMRFLREFKTRGTLLFVSHDDAAVSGLCDRALWLEGGETRALGSAKDVVYQYLQSVIASRQTDGNEPSPHAPTLAAVVSEPIERYDARRDWINQSALRNDIEVMPFEINAEGFGIRKAMVERVEILDEVDRPLSWVVGGELATLEVTARADDYMRGPIIGFYLKDRLGQDLFGDNTLLTTGIAVEVAPGERFCARFKFQMPRLKAGDYFFTIAVAEGTLENHVIHHWIHEALTLKSQTPEWASGLIGIPMLDIQLVKPA